MAKMKQDAVNLLEHDIHALQQDLDLWRMRKITAEQKRQNVVDVIEKVKVSCRKLTIL